MKIKIPKRTNAPETNIFVKVIRKNFNTDLRWDRPVMFLVPGGPGGNHTLYADIEEELLFFADLVVIDLRGCGLSDKSDVNFCTIDHHADDIEAIRSILKIKKPILHGCSYGAFVALNFAIKYSSSLSYLILSSGAASGEFIIRAQENLKKLGNPQQIAAAEKLWNGNFESPDQFVRYYELMSNLYIHSEAPNNLPASKYNIPYNIELINFAFKSFLRTFDYRDYLNLINIPTLIFSGEKDWITDSEQANILHKGIRNSKLVSLAKCGHFPWKDRKDKFLAEIDVFLKSNL